MRSKKTKKILCFAAALAFALSMVSCGDVLGDLLGGKEDSIPEDILDLADGIFSFIDMVFESEGDDPTQGDYPDGMTVAWITPPTHLRITLTNFSPEDAPGVLVNGSIDLTQTSTNPLTINIAGTINVSNYKYSTAVLSGSAVWAAGVVDPSDADPVSITGTFTVDGKTYKISDIVSALDDRENGEGGGTPATFTPVPSSMWGLSYYLRVQRPASGGAWTPGDNTNMDFNPTGTGWGLYGGTSAGYVNWYTAGGTQKMDFWDANKQQKLFSFSVLSHSGTELHLLGQWTGEERQLYFNTSGLYSGPYPD